MATTAAAKRLFKSSTYNVIRALGTGAHSTIWEVRDKKTSKAYALKRVIKFDKEDEKFFEQTVNEFVVGSRISHPNVRRVFDLTRVRKLFAVKELHLLMELCPGRSVQAQPPKTILEACCVFAQVANALYQINQAGFVHADMKPNNIIVDENGNVKVIDLGQSCEIGTIKQRIQGTPDYIAPEQVIRAPLDPRTDVYNFGATFYWALTGKAPPSVLPNPNSLQTTGRGEVTPPCELDPNIPASLSWLIIHCMELEPKRRPQNMQIVRGRLGTILHQELNQVKA